MTTEEVSQTIDLGTNLELGYDVELKKIALKDIQNKRVVLFSAQKVEAVFIQALQTSFGSNPSPRWRCTSRENDKVDELFFSVTEKNSSSSTLRTLFCPAEGSSVLSWRFVEPNDINTILKQLNAFS